MLTRPGVEQLEDLGVSDRHDWGRGKGWEKRKSVLRGGSVGQQAVGLGERRRWIWLSRVARGADGRTPPPHHPRFRAPPSPFEIRDSTDREKI